MKTINKNVFIFKTEKQALSFFNKQVHAELLQEINGFPTSMYFVELPCDEDARCIVCWPNHYKLLIKK